MTNECSVTPEDRARYGTLTEAQIDEFDQPAFEAFEASLTDHNSAFLRWYEANHESIGSQQTDEAGGDTPVLLLPEEDLGE
jgi:hypothetical protein